MVWCAFEQGNFITNFRVVLQYVFPFSVPTLLPTAPAFAANKAVAEEVQIPAQAPVPFAKEVEFPLEDQMREMSVGDAVTRYEFNERLGW